MQGSLIIIEYNSKCLIDFIKESVKYSFKEHFNSFDQPEVTHWIFPMNQFYWESDYNAGQE